MKGKRAKQNERRLTSLKKKLRGPIYSRLVYLTRSFVEKNTKLLTHAEALTYLGRWYKRTYAKTNLAIASNYPYVLKSEFEIVQPIDEYKMIVLPSMEFFSRKSLLAFRHIILNDMRARLHEISPLLHKRINFKVSSEIPDENDLLALCEALFVEHSKLTNLSEKEKIIRVNNATFSHIPNPRNFNSVDDYLQQKINANVHKQYDFKNILMKGNVKYLSLFQGKNSFIRQSIVRRIKSFRAQQAFRPDLKPNEIILPHTWQQELGIFAQHMIDTTNLSKTPEHHFIQLTDVRVCAKRDPALNRNSCTFYDRIGFAKTENIFVGPGELGHKNSDFDGDAQIVNFFVDPLEVLEIDLNVLPQNNMKSFNTCRVTFTESQILTMHQRPLPPDYIHTKLYDFVRENLTIEWKNNVANKITLKKLESIYPHVDFERFIEPTNSILETTLSIITQRHGSKAGYDFYNYININVLALANGEPTEFSCNHLPGQYVLGDNILCESILRACMSGAKGSINTIDTLAKQFTKNDNTTDITPKAAPLIRKGLFQAVDGTSKNMSHSSKSVQQHGFAFFKSNMSYSFFSFDNNKLNYRGKVIHDNLDFLSPEALINPMIAYSIFAGV